MNTVKRGLIELTLSSEGQGPATRFTFFNMCRDVWGYLKLLDLAIACGNKKRRRKASFFFLQSEAGYSGTQMLSP